MVVSEGAKAILRRLEPSCRRIVFVPEMIEVNDAYHPDRTKLRCLSIVGEVAGQRSVAFVTLCGEWWQRRSKC